MTKWVMDWVIDQMDHHTDPTQSFNHIFQIFSDFCGRMEWILIGCG